MVKNIGQQIIGQRKFLTVLVLAASLAGCSSYGPEFERQMKNEQMRLEERARNQEMQRVSAEIQQALKKARADAEYERRNPGFFTRLFGG
ncbi:MAG: hypothetical protein Q8O24_00565 [Gallionellaceae bacterium]|nr:hypothetical protein [Gallionellaceae bacterium]